MRIAIVSDIHANLDAFTKALSLIDEQGVDAIYCLGDVVGYGGEPGPCVDLVRERCALTVKGNHDVAVAEGIGMEYLPKDGQKAARKHQALLSQDQLDFLAGLPLVETTDTCTLVHAAPEHPAAWQRLDSYFELKGQFNYFQTPFCFIGHSHRPGVVADKLGVSKVKEGHRYLLNVGSIGQPRDGDARLSFGLLDTEAVSFEIVRAHYDVEAAARKIKAAGLPRSLGKRLAKGE